MVPEGFLEGMWDKFYELCQVFERSDGNTQGITDYVYQQLCALVHREVEKLKVSSLTPARRRHKRAKPWW